MSLLDSIKNNDIERLKAELHDNPSQNQLDICLQEAAIKGFSGAVKILLKDGRANPAACSPAAADFAVAPNETLSYALQMASHQGFDDIVEMLLNDGRSDPSSGDYRAVKLAAAAGKTAVLKKIDDYFYDNYIDYKSKIGTALADRIAWLLQSALDEQKSDSESSTYGMWNK